MCGLCGFTGEVVDREEVIRNMTRVITHRGPDSDGFFTEDDGISMGFRRLRSSTLSRAPSRFTTRTEPWSSCLTERFTTIRNCAPS